MGLFTDIPSAREMGKRRTFVQDKVKAETYGNNKQDPDRWSLTMLLDGTTKNSISTLIKQHLTGEDERHQPIPGYGINMPFTLRVLTRQACCEDANGKKLKPDELSATDPPLPGDVVEIKGRRRPPENGIGPSTDDFNLWELRGERRHEYKRYVVDENLCISGVTYVDAIRFLARSGKRIRNAQHRREEPTKRDLELYQAGIVEEKPRIRFISNWHFEEVFPGEEVKPEPKNRNRKPRKQTEPTPENTASEE